jgi:hypothetical protein
MKRDDLGKMVFLGVLKVDSVSLPSFSSSTLYFDGSGFKLALMKLSLVCFFLMEYLELLANLEIVSKLGLY